MDRGRFAKGVACALLLGIAWLVQAPLAPAGDPSSPAPAATAFPYELSIHGGDRPLRIRFSVTVNGKPWRQYYSQIQRQYVRAAFVQLDADRDGTLSADEARRLPPPRAWATLPGGDEVHVAFNYRLLDADGDGAVTPAEFEEYAQAFGDLPVRLSSVPAGRATDDLFHALDANRDRILTAAEWSLAAKLIEKDRDGNGVLTAEELRGPMSTVMPPEFVAAAAGDRARRKPVEFELQPATDLPAAAEIAIDYADAAAAPRRPHVRVTIAAEATGLIAKPTHPAHGDPVLVIAGRRLVLRIPPPAVRPGTALRQQLLNEFAAAAEEAGAEVTAAASLPALLKGLFGIADRNDDGRLEKAELESYLDGVFLHQTAADAACLRFVKFQERPGLMPVADRNLDGRLSRRELQLLPAELAAIAGAAGRLTREEFPSTIVLLVQHGPFGDSSDQNPLENAGPPWFFRADRNHDGDLDREEFLGAPADFDRLDLNRDGWIDLDEAVLGDGVAGSERPRPDTG